ncbi:tetratricopeptide repeat protein [Streptomyces sp. NPDC005322]|uniref:tetratricopeptide repeat protein n=1 Tax=Streptomyces sp. NPDC005322 TaxID=3157032 RepID=UPI0033A1DA08
MDRRVQIRHHRPLARPFGSGYLVAPRLVLTSAHVLRGESGWASGRVTVARPQPIPFTLQGDARAAAEAASRREFAATVLWKRYDNLVDAALIEIDDFDGWQPPESLEDVDVRPPQRWGHLIGSAPHGVLMAGFPRAQREDGRRLDGQVAGRIYPGNGSLAHRYEISSSDETTDPDTRKAGSTRWSGISGAAVIAGDFLCGVTRSDRQATGGTRLTATQTAALIADAEFRDLITVHSGWEPVLEPVEPDALFSPAVEGRFLSSPAALLRADLQVVAFRGRESELAELSAWCTDGRARLSARVVVGPGGQGKSRLARQLTTRLGNAGWVTGHLRPNLVDKFAETLDLGTLITTTLPVLLVVDYAETRPELVRRLVAGLLRSRHRVRLLLIARADGGWRTDSLSAEHATRTVMDTAEVVELGPLVPRDTVAQGRPELFRQAASDLARHLPEVPSVPSHDWLGLAEGLTPAKDLNDRRYDNVLTLQMAALTTLLQLGPTPVRAAKGTSSEEILLKHEGRFWSESAKAPAFLLPLAENTLSRMVAVAALCGAEDEAEALEVIGILPDIAAERRLDAVRWLAQLYPSGPERYWGSLQPDRVAEFHASRAIAEGVRLPALLAAASPTQQTRIVTILARSAAAHVNGRRTDESDAVLTALDSALDASPLHAEAVRPTVNALIDSPRVVAPLARRLTGELVDAFRRQAADGDEAALGRALSHLGRLMAELGDWQEAATQEGVAVEILRRHAPDNPVERESLALSLTNLGVYLSYLGRWEEALRVGEESTAIYEAMDQANLPFDRSDFATALSDLSVRLAEVGQHTRALSVAERAVDIQRRMAEQDPAAYERRLARSLSNLGVRLAGNRRWSEALAVQQQATEIMRRNAAVNPAAFESAYADTLLNLGVRHLDVGRWQEALEAEQSAVDIYRRLTARNPAVHELNLSGVLANLSNSLSTAGRHEEALAAVTEAVAIRRRLAEDNPAVYEPELALALQNLGSHLSDLGRHREALTAAEEAVEIHRRYAELNPAIHSAGYAATLFNLGVHLRAAGQRVDGVEAVEQALEIFRGLEATSPKPHQLALVLVHLVGALPSIGRNDETLALAEEAEAIYRKLADNPAFEPPYAGLLTSLSQRRDEAGDAAGAVDTAERSVEIYRRLAADRPHLFEDSLVTALGTLGLCLSSVGRVEEALSVAEEAVQICRRSAQTNPTGVHAGLPSALNVLAVHLTASGRTEEALTVAEEAVVVARAHAEADPAGSEHLLALALKDLAVRLTECPGRSDEGRSAADEAVETFRRVEPRDPGTFEQYLALHLAGSLWLAACYRAEDDAEGALKLLSESEAVLARLDARQPGAFAAQVEAIGAARAELLRQSGLEDLPGQDQARVLQDGTTP